MKPDWKRAPAWAYAFAKIVYKHETSAKDFAWISRDGYIVANEQYLHDNCWPYSEQNFSADDFQVLEYRPDSGAWSGEGLPPVGTVCEFAGFNPEETLPSDPLIGDRVTVIAHFKSGSIDLAAFTFFAPPDFEYLQVSQGAYGCFRPIRTPEQIEEEKRQQAIAEMLSFVKGEVGRDALFDLYEAGYRKQVAP